MASSAICQVLVQCDPLIMLKVFLRANLQLRYIQGTVHVELLIGDRGLPLPTTLYYYYVVN